MKTLFSFILLHLFVASAPAISGENYRVVHFNTTVPKETQFEMLDHDGLMLVLQGEWAAYEVTAKSGALADCKIVREKSNGGEKTAVVQFEPALDDGINSCTVHLTSRNGKQFQLELFVDVSN